MKIVFINTISHIRKSSPCLWILLFVTTGCAHNSQVTWKIDNREQLKITLQEHIPPGTPIDTAKRYMEKEGFSCTYSKNSSFTERKWWGDKEPAVEVLECLYCDRTQYAGSIFMVRKTAVALVMENGVVKDILTSSYVDGP